MASFSCFFQKGLSKQVGLLLSVKGYGRGTEQDPDRLSLTSRNSGVPRRLTH